LKQCSWCSNYFAANVPYQIYCSSECREEATKEKIVERHKEVRRRKRSSKTRMCAAKCGTKLSIYNDHTLCNSCYVNQKEVNKKMREIKVFMHDYQDDTK
jgi:hypothetical protein